MIVDMERRRLAELQFEKHRPTLHWIFPCFQSIHVVTLSQEEHISNWTQERDCILNLVPYHCFPYYQLLT